MNCQACMHWNLKNNQHMAKLGFGTCNLQANQWVFFPLQHTCVMFKQANDEIVRKRQLYFENK